MKDKSTILPIDPRRADVAAMIARADDYLLSRYPPDICYLESAAELASPNATLLGVFEGQALMGVGAVRTRSDNSKPYGEIKRVFIADEARGKGLGKRLIQALETQLVTAGIEWVRLETGVHQPEAVSLYESLEYRRCGPFGDYRAHEQSIFMEKRLSGL